MNHPTFLWPAGGLLCLALASTASAADAPSVEERLKQLESQVKSLAKENQDLKKELGWDGKVASAVTKPAGKEAKLVLGGLLQAQAEFGREPDARFVGIEDRFLIRRARINVSGTFLEQFDFKIEGDFGANSLSEQTSYRAGLTDAYLNWNRFSEANVKVGQFKTPFGYEQLVADPKLTTIERSLVNDRLTDSRQIGVGVSGDFLEKRLSYSVGMFNGTSVNNSFNDNEGYLYAGRVFGSPVVTKWGKEDVKWTLGLDALYSHDAAVTKSGFGFDSVPGGTADNLFNGQRYSVGADTQLKAGPFGLEAEYLVSHFDVDNSIPSDSVDSHGFFITGTYFILPKKLQGLVRYEWFDSNTDLDDTTSQEVTFGINYYIKGDDLKLGVNYLLGDPAGDEGWNGRLLLRAQVAF